MKTLQRRLTKACMDIAGKESNPVTTTTQIQATTSQPGEFQRLQLEKLKPPTFDGDHTKWLLFKQQFTDIVIEGEKYSKTSQGHVLKSLVLSEARDRIEHLQSTFEMFTVLDEMYGDVATSVSILVNRLLLLKLTKTTDYDKILCAKN